MQVDAGTAIVVLGRGGIGSAAKTELAALVASTRQSLQGLACPVVAAFVDRNAPALPDALDGLVQEGAESLQTIVIVPVFVPDEPALRRWLQKVVLRWRAQRALMGALPRTVFTSPLLQTHGLPALLLEAVSSASTLDDVATLLADEDWQSDPKAWSEVPEHQQHVLWCTGPRCTAKGALSLWPKLAQVVREDPVLKKKLMLLQTSCQFPCNLGPLMMVYPEGVWYGKMDEGALHTVLTDHVRDGQVNRKHCVHGAPALGRVPERPKA